MEFHDGAPEDAGLSESLNGLASPVRLLLLRQLRIPKTLREIELRVEGTRDPAGGHAAGGARPLSRQAVKFQLDHLVEIGIVSARETERDYGPTVEYVLNHQRLFAIAEGVRELAKLRPAAEPDDPTMHGVAPASTFEVRGPCLILAKGLNEGRFFDLKPPSSGSSQWTIGRKRGLEVSLDFDPFVSTENSSIVYESGSYFIQDLPDNRNGTALNFQPLGPGQRHGLVSGDLIGVGRSLLLFRR